MNETVPMWAFVAILGGFQLLLGMMLMRLWKSVDENTAAVTGLRVDIPTTYASKADFKEYRERVHDVSNELHLHELKKAHG